MECRGTGYTGANMSVTYFADGQAQMEKVKEKKEQERKNMPHGKFICGLNGCTESVANAHQGRHAAHHNMSLREYKDARIAMKKGNYKPEEPTDLEKEVKENPENDKIIRYDARDELKATIPEVKEIPEEEEFMPSDIVPEYPDDCDKPDTLSIPKQIIEVTEYTCPHCGGKLKIKE